MSPCTFYYATAGFDYISSQTAFVMIAETVSLGILSLPSTLKAVGLIPYEDP